MPVHGEYRHLVAHARLAGTMGVAGGPRASWPRTATGSCSTTTACASTGGCPPDYLYVDGTVGDVGHGVLRDRRILADEGVVVVIVVRRPSSRAQSWSGPEIVTRGWVYEPEAEDLLGELGRAGARRRSTKALADGADVASIERAVRRAVGRLRVGQDPATPDDRPGGARGLSRPPADRRLVAPVRTGDGSSALAAVRVGAREYRGGTVATRTRTTSSSRSGGSGRSGGRPSPAARPSSTRPAKRASSVVRHGPPRARGLGPHTARRSPSRRRCAPRRRSRPRPVGHRPDHRVGRGGRERRTPTPPARSASPSARSSQPLLGGLSVPGARRRSPSVACC